MKLVVQAEQLGLGHAVLTAQQMLTAEPFLLMLGDHLYRSTHAEGLSCVQQLLRAYQGTSIMAVRRTPEEAISHYGTVSGSWEVRRGTPSYERLTVSSITEKPTAEYARLNLTTPGLADGEYLTAFGLYIITEAKLMEILSEHREQHTDTHLAHLGPLQLTPALDQLRQEYGLQGFCVQGERYDIGGEPHTYVHTLNALAKPPPGGSGAADTPSGSPVPKRARGGK